MSVMFWVLSENEEKKKNFCTEDTRYKDKYHYQSIQ